MFVEEGEDMADLKWCGSVIGGFVVCEFLCLLEDSPDGCRQNWLGWVREMKGKRMYPSYSC